MENSPESNTPSPEVKAIKKLPRGSIQLQFAGDLILAKSAEHNFSGLFKKYTELFEDFANMEREERMINYKFLNALMLTSYAKKSNSQEEKKLLFDKKNTLFLDIANNPKQRKKINLRYLDSKNFRVVEFCKTCTETNEKEKTKRHKWKFCKKCKLDRDFYNIISMHHKYQGGEACLFLSNDQAAKLKLKNLKISGQTDDFKEQLKYNKYIYSIRNLDAIDLDSALAMYKKILGK
jgi:hypothetical protein